MRRYTTSPRRALLALIAVFTLSLAAVACGGDDEPASGGGGGGSEQASAAPDCGQGCSIGISVPEAQNPFYLAFSEAM